MLWFRLLPNTIYCGTLHFTPSQIDLKGDWSGFLDYDQKFGGKRQTSKNLCSPHYAASILNILSLATKKEEG